MRCAAGRANLWVKSVLLVRGRVTEFHRPRIEQESEWLSDLDTSDFEVIAGGTRVVCIVPELSAVAVLKR